MVPAARTMRGISPCPAKTAIARSPASLLVGIPVEGPARWVSMITTGMFAALDVKTGRAVGECHRRHRAVEFRKFLDKVDAAVPADLDIHMTGVTHSP